MSFISRNPKNGTSVQSLDISRIIYTTLSVPCLLLAVLWIGYTITHSAPEDFRVFYESARTAISGISIYRTYGPIQLPYWYFPWLAWFYIPLGLLPHGIAYILYMTITLVWGFITINYLIEVFVPAANLMERLFTFCMGLVMCWLLFQVGQMDFILLAIAVLMIYLINKDRSSFAGLLVPILLFKPHLFILFLPFAWFKGKKSFLISATVVCLILIVISFIIIPNWPQQMIEMLAKSGHRTDNNWNFTTLPNLIGMQENWSGTANLPITMVLILIGAALLWKLKALDVFPLLSLALAASIFCAPRAYSYNFPLLIPAMIWISSDMPKSLRYLFWFAAGTLPFLFRFSTGTYSIVLVVFFLGINKAYKELFSSRPNP